MKTPLAILAILLSITTQAQTVYVPPSVDKNGNMHQGHYRSAPNSTRSDNLNAQNNIYGGTNPYTGHRGTQRDEFSSPPVYNRTNPAYVPPAPSIYAPPQPTQRPRSPY